MKFFKCIDQQLTSCSPDKSGIGLQLATQVLAKGTYHVILGSRSVERGSVALEDLQSRDLSGSIELLQIDSTSDESISTAAKDG